MLGYYVALGARAAVKICVVEVKSDPVEHEICNVRLAL